jgi:DNA-binding protein H-NS
MRSISLLYSAALKTGATMATYLELKEQAEKLLAQAEELRQRETEQAITEIKDKMRAYGLTAKDLGFAGGGAGTGTRRTQDKKTTPNTAARTAKP